MAHLLYIGFTHRTTPLAVRERIVPAAEALEAYARGVQALAVESAVLRTCGRFETFVAPGPGFPSTRRASAALTTQILDILAGCCGSAPDMLRSQARVLSDEQVERHLLRVAAGLDSPILGEDHILGQVREGLEQAQSAATSGPVLSALFRAAIHAGKRVRSETPIQRVASSFVDQAARALAERRRHAHDSRLLILGSGRMAEELAGRAAVQGWRRMIIAGRHAQRTHDLATRVGGSAVAFEDLVPQLARADAAVACTSSTQALITTAGLQAACALRPQADANPNSHLLLIDLGMPRNVEADVARLPGVTVLDLDDLAQRYGGAADAGLHEAVQAAERIVEEELARLRRWMTARRQARHGVPPGGKSPTVERRLAG